MKIKNLKMINFMGLQGAYDMDIPHIVALVGPNGMGKTTILNAIRFGLTGAEPEGEIINLNSTQMTVEITLTSIADGADYVFTRIKDMDKPSKCKVNGKASTQKTMNAKIEECIGIPLDKVKILSSAEVVAAMKPDDFSSFILNYIPEKLTTEDVIAMVPDTTIGMVNIMDMSLPEEVDLPALENFTDYLKGERKNLKAVIAAKKVLAEQGTDEKPEGSREDAEKRLAELANIEAEYKIYQAKLDAYNRAVSSVEKQKEQIEKVRAEMEAINANRPNPVIMDNLKKERQDILDSISNQKVALQGAASGLKQLEITLAALEKPICPISPLITCHQDKTVAKQDISESIESTRTGIDALEAEVTKLQAKLADVEAKIDSAQAEAKEYDKKIALGKQLKSLEDSAVDLPAKPQEVELPDVNAERYTLNSFLEKLKAWEEKEKAKELVRQLTEELESYEKLVKAFADNGVVRNTIIRKYLGVFEDICNKRSQAIRPEISFKVDGKDNGVVVLMDTGKGNYLPYQNLSGGEKAYMLFIIMDMLNSLTGSNILMLDELSVVDSKSFDALLDIVMQASGSYDHIMIAAVDHVDTVQSIVNHGLNPEANGCINGLVYSDRPSGINGNIPQEENDGETGEDFGIPFV